jgi:hypothetical protein
MDLVLQIRFWAGLFAALIALSAAGATLAWVIVPTPPVYHRTSFFEFPLPPDWSCDREGTETVCSPDEATPHTAIIIIAAKWRGPDDTRETYVEHLSKPIVWKTLEGKQVRSEVLFVRETMLGGHDWVDSRHRSSAIENYVTRYMGATTTDIGILVTYSIHETRLDEYDPPLNAAVEGLDIYQRATVAAVY